MKAITYRGRGESFKSSLHGIGLFTIFSLHDLSNPNKYIWLLLFRLITYHLSKMSSMSPLSLCSPFQQERDAKGKQDRHRLFQPSHPTFFFFFFCTSPDSRGLIFVFPVPLRFEVSKNEQLSSDFIWNQAPSEGSASACCLDTHSLLIEFIKK